MKGQEIDHVISGPMRGLKKTGSDGGAIRQTDKQTERQTSGHCDSMTDPAQRAESEKTHNSMLNK